MKSNVTPARDRQAVTIIPLMLALALIGASGSASAQWLDKLKGMLGDDSKEQSLSSDEIGGGLKEALRVGTENVVADLGKTDGFNLDPKVHIPLPSQLDQIKSVLGKIGMDLDVGRSRTAPQPRGGNRNTEGKDIIHHCG